MEDFGILPAVDDTRPVVVAAVLGVAFAGPMYGSRPFGNEPLHWGPCCLILYRVPFAENDFCFAADTPPAVDIVATAGGVAAVATIAVAVSLVVTAIDFGGPKVARLYNCYSNVPLFVALVCALGVVAASALRLLLGLLGPRMPSVPAAHLLRPVVPHFVLLPTRCTLFLALLPLSIPPAHAVGLIGCLRGPVALPFLYFPLGGVLLRRILFAGLGCAIFNRPLQVLKTLLSCKP